MFVGMTASTRYSGRGIVMEPIWLDWARKLNALAQTGLTFAESPYDIERYTAIRTIAADMITHGSGEDLS